MLRYKTQVRPGLVALYDIRPGNGAGLFLQPRSPHGAADSVEIRPSPRVILLDLVVLRYMVWYGILEFNVPLDTV